MDLNAMMNNMRENEQAYYNRGQESMHHDVSRNMSDLQNDPSVGLLPNLP